MTLGSLFPDLPASVAGGGYLPSVQFGGIAAVFARVVTHFLPLDSLVVDVTHRIGQFWERCSSGFRVVRLDLDRSCPVDAVADCTAVPLRSGCADALVFDPPWSFHGVDAASGEEPVKRGYAAKRYAATITDARDFWRLVDAGEWARVVRPGGLLFVRIADYHQGGKFLGLCARMVLRVQSPLWDPWDRVIHVHGKIAPRYPMDAKHPKTVKHHSEIQVYRRTKE